MARELISLLRPDDGAEWEMWVEDIRRDEGGIDDAIRDSFATQGVPACTLDVCGDHGLIGVWRWDGEDARRALRCPSCEAALPERHPAYAADGGEVSLCTDPWHRYPTPGNPTERVAQLRRDLARVYPDRTGWWRV